MPDPQPPHLTRLDVDTPRGVVLMLHGGTAHSHAPVDERSASWRRSAWMMRSVSGRLHGGGLAVWLLRYRARGWNEDRPTPSPVPDARWALDQVRTELGSLPVVLVGHSMGARTAVAVADDPDVTGVVALAPWLPAGERVAALAGKHLAAAHGRADNITSARQTEIFVHRAREVAASAEFTDMGRVGHYMFRRIAAWNRFAAEHALAFAEDPARR